MSAPAVPAVDAAAFRETLGHYPTGVAVVTACDTDGAPIGMVVGTFSSISLDPPLVSFSPQKNSATFALLRECETFGVNVLAADQEDLCRRMATGGAQKFDGVEWTIGAHGAPIIDGVVAWVECAWDQIVEAGDHYIVLGQVLALDVPRPTPPLLFFQGSYGKFSTPSLMAAAHPDLLQAVRMAETIRADVEACAAELELTCSVSAQLDGEIVTLLVAQGADGDEEQVVGQRVPHLAPVGSAFLVEASDNEVVRWSSHLGAEDELIDQLDANLETVRRRGYSVALRTAASADRRQAMADYSDPDSLPSHEREVRRLMAGSVRDYEPVIEAGAAYDLYSITVPVLGVPGPSLAVRVTGLPAASGETVTTWIHAVQACARSAQAKLAAADS